jgi:ATP-dependent helicase HepA
VDALPGLDLSEERSYLGTFWRDTAVEQEEIDLFTTGHPLVESLFAYLRDGELGRVAALRLSKSGLPAGAKGLVFSYVVQAPEAEDLEQGAAVASRQAMRYLDQRLLSEAIELRGGELVPRPDWVRTWSSDSATAAAIGSNDLPSRSPSWRGSVARASEVAGARAEADLVAAKEAGLRRLEAERDEALRTVDRWLRFRGASADDATQERTRELAAFDAVAHAIRNCRLELDSATFIEVLS